MGLLWSPGVVPSSHTSAYQEVNLGIVSGWNTKDVEQGLWINAMTETYRVTNGPMVE